MPLIIAICIRHFYLENFIVLRRESCPVHLCFTDKKKEAQPVRAGFAPNPEDECLGHHLLSQSTLCFLSKANIPPTRCLEK